MCDKYANQFWIVDESGRVAIHEYAGKKKLKLKAEEIVSNGILTCCDIEPREGKFIATGGVDTKITISKINPDTIKGQKINFMETSTELTGHGGTITSLRFLDSQFLVSSSDDSKIMLWDLERPDRYLVKYDDHTVQVWSLDCFNLDGNIIASGSSDTTLKIWDIRSKNPCIRTFDRNDSSVNCVRFMYDQGHTVAAGCDDSSIIIYDLRAIVPVAWLREDTSFESITSLSFSRSNRLLFSATKTTVIRVWDVLKEEKIDQIDTGHTDNIKCLALSADGSTLASAGKDGLIQFWS